MKRSYLLLASLMVAVIAIVGYSFVYAGSTSSDVDSADKTECPYSKAAEDGKDCSESMRKHCKTKDGNAQCDRAAKKSCRSKCTSKGDGAEQHAPAETAPEGIDFN